MSCTLEPAIQSCDTGQWMPFLTANHNIDVHLMSTQIVYTLDTQLVMPGHYKNILPALQPIRAKMSVWPAEKTSRQKSSGSLETRKRKWYLLSQCMHVNLFAFENFAEKRVLKLVKPCFLGPISFIDPICC